MPPSFMLPLTSSLPPQSTRLNGECARPLPAVLPILDLSSPEPAARPTSSNSIYKTRGHFACWMSAFRDLPRGPIRPGVQRVERKWSITPEMKVSLEDILNMRHVSPIGLKDFEQYLLFEEYSVENLYFVLWMKDYTARYDAGVSSPQLLHSISRAKATFLTPHSQYELNLPAPRVDEFLAVARDTNQSAYTSLAHSLYGWPSPPLSSSTFVPIAPHPSVFASVHNDVESMLRISAGRFIRARSRNVAYQNSYCVLFGGLPALALTLAPLLVSILCHRGRWIRFAMIAPLWVGMTMVICLLNGICVIVYLIAGSRQLYPFELHQPPISLPLSHKVPLVVHKPSFATVETLRDVKLPLPCAFPSSPSTGSFDSHGLPGHDSCDADAGLTVNGMQAGSYMPPGFLPANPITEFTTSGFIPSQDPHPSNAHAVTDLESSWSYLDPPSAAAHMSKSTVRLAFDFDALPAKSLDSTTGPDVLRAARGSGVEGLINNVFAPLTRVESPVVSRVQRQVIIRAMAMAMFVALIVTGVFVVVPV